MSYQSSALEDQKIFKKVGGDSEETRVIVGDIEKTIIVDVKEGILMKENTDRKKDIQEEINKTYKAWCDSQDENEQADFKCTTILNTEPVSGKSLLEPINTLTSKPALYWTREDVIPIVELLAGKIGVDGTGDNFEGANAFLTIGTALKKFLCDHSDLRGMLDPIYVVAGIDGQLIPQLRLNNYPSVGGPLPFMTSNVWVFTGNQRNANAHHFIGVLQIQVNGIRCFLFHTSFIAAYF
ncbi:hypothetical protein C1645_758429 [Glomus cerebriforme]|uniref:Uncharacterized protein n=1 Tax=Glomus cerebriforme TaxID=658196 RepID=A0A397T9X2_9GLOM|nr:hypothetical protein C1645_758429 [Glomus cerebriforme]